MSYRELRKRATEKERHRARSRTSDEAEDKKMIAAAVHKHERHDHPGTKETKLKRGGHVEGGKSAPRCDRYARGGKVKGKSGGKTQINVLIGTPGGAAGPGPMARPPMPMMPPPHPAMAGPPMPPPGAGPMGAPPMGGGVPPGMPMRPPGAKNGGRIGRAMGGRVPEKISARMKEKGAGGGGAEGRLIKTKAYGPRP